MYTMTFQPPLTLHLSVATKPLCSSPCPSKKGKRIKNHRVIASLGSRILAQNLISSPPGFVLNVAAEGDGLGVIPLGTFKIFRKQNNEYEALPFRNHGVVPLGALRNLRGLVFVAASSPSSSAAVDNNSADENRHAYDLENVINQLIALAPRGSIAKCMETYKSKLSLQDFSVVFREFAQRGDWQRALRLFKYMQRQQWCFPNEHIYTIMIGMLGREGLLEKALELFEEMPSNGVPWNVYSFTALINAYGRNGHYKASLDLLLRMRDEGIPPNVITFNTVMNACARGGMEWHGLLEIFAQMRRDRVQPDLVTYNTLLSACVLRSLVPESRKVFLSLLHARLSPDLLSFSSLVQAHAQANDLRSAFSLLLSNVGAKGGVVPFNMLIEAAGRKGQWELAEEIFRSLRSLSLSPDVSSFSLLLHAYGRAGEYERVRDLFGEMKREGVSPDAHTFSTLLLVLNQGGFFKECVALFADMKREGRRELERGAGEEGEEEGEGEEEEKMTSLSYELLLEACAKGGMEREASEIYRYFLKEREASLSLSPSQRLHSLSPLSFSWLVLCFGNASKYDECENLLHDFLASQRESGREWDGESEREGGRQQHHLVARSGLTEEEGEGEKGRALLPYYALIRVFSQALLPDRSSQVLDRLLTHLSQPGTSGDRRGGGEEEQYRTASFKLSSPSFSLVPSLPVPLSLRIYHSLALGYARAGMTETALDLCQSSLATESSLFPPNSSHSPSPAASALFLFRPLHSSLLISLCLEGSFERALAQYLDMRVRGWKASVQEFCQLVAVGARRQRWVECRKILEEMLLSSSPSLSPTRSISRAGSWKGETGKARGGEEESGRDDEGEEGGEDGSEEEIDETEGGEPWFGVFSPAIMQTVRGLLRGEFNESRRDEGRGDGLQERNDEYQREGEEEEEDEDFTWQIVSHMFDLLEREGVEVSRSLLLPLLDSLWFLGQKRRAGSLMRMAIQRGVFKEAKHKTAALWGIDVHRMSVGAALTLFHLWMQEVLRDIRGEDEETEGKKVERGRTGDDAFPALLSIKFRWGHVPLSSGPGVDSPSPSSSANTMHSNAYTNTSTSASTSPFLAPALSPSLSSISSPDVSLSPEIDLLPAHRAISATLLSLNSSLKQVQQQERARGERERERASQGHGADPLLRETGERNKIGRGGVAGQGAEEAGDASHDEDGELERDIFRGLRPFNVVPWAPGRLLSDRERVRRWVKEWRDAGQESALRSFFELKDASNPLLPLSGTRGTSGISDSPPKTVSGFLNDRGGNSWQGAQGMGGGGGEGGAGGDGTRYNNAPLTPSSSSSAVKDYAAAGAGAANATVAVTALESSPGSSYSGNSSSSSSGGAVSSPPFSAETSGTVSAPASQRRAATLGLQQQHEAAQETRWNDVSRRVTRSRLRPGSSSQQQQPQK